MKKAEGKGIRQSIYNLIKHNPGLHLSKIAEMLDLRISHVEYYLSQMEKNEEVLSVVEEGRHYRRYFINDSALGVEEKQYVVILRHEAPLRIVLLLIRNQRLRHRDLLQILDLSSSTLSYHITKMIQYNIIDVINEGEEKGYTLKNKKKVLWLLFRYKLHKVLDEFKDIWIDFNY